MGSTVGHIPKVKGSAIGIDVYKRQKEERAGGRLWDIVERCISLNADDRYSASELLEALEELREMCIRDSQIGG